MASGSQTVARLEISDGQHATRLMPQYPIFNRKNKGSRLMRLAGKVALAITALASLIGTGARAEPPLGGPT